MTASDHLQRLQAIKDRVPLPDIIGADIALEKDGNEFRAVGSCPFHAENTSSFTVYRRAGQWSYHCFGCGAHGDAIDWLRDYRRLSWREAAETLEAWTGESASGRPAIAASSTALDPAWCPIHPVPDDAPALIGRDGRARVFNPKRAGTDKEWSTLRPRLVHRYNDAAGRLLGFVLRCEFTKDGKPEKFTPQVTYCEGKGGERRWCMINFAEPRPLYGLDQLAARRDGEVILVEGEKTVDAARRLLQDAVILTWPGGANGYTRADWLPLAGRKVLGIPDADAAGRNAFDGRTTPRGEHVPGILEILAGLGADARRVEPPAGTPDHWDLADAEAAGWDAARALVWINTNRLANAPQSEPEPVQHLRRFAPKPTHDGRRSRKAVEWGRLIATEVTGSQRVATITKLANHLLRRYVDPYLAAGLLAAWNGNKCQPPLADNEVIAAVNEVARREVARRELRHVR